MHTSLPILATYWRMQAIFTQSLRIIMFGGLREGGVKPGRDIVTRTGSTTGFSANTILELEELYNQCSKSKNRVV